jgi:nucleotide-binding universal stress UspA family protein
MSEEEKDRLQEAERRKESFLPNLKRVLIPMSDDASSKAAQRLASLMLGDEDVEVTTLQLRIAPDHDVANGVEDEEGAPVIEADEAPAAEAKPRLVVRNVEGLPSEAVIAEAAKGYDLVVLGAEHLATHARPARPNGGNGTGRFSTDRLRRVLRLDNDDAPARSEGEDEDEIPSPSGPLFDEFVDRVIQRAPCPVLILSADAGSLDWTDDPDALDHILLPVWGSASDQFGAEIAFSIAKGRDATVHVMHAHPKRRQREGDGLASAHIGEELVRQIAEIGDWVGATVEAEVVVADRPERAIVERAKRGIDLIVLETARSPVTQRAFLGHHIDHVLHHAPCAVALIAFKAGMGHILAVGGSNQSH